MRFPRTKYGLAINPVGEYVAFDYQGRRLLGEIVQVSRDEVRGVTVAMVRHFNGDPWPVAPIVAALEWIRQ